MSRCLLDSHALIWWFMDSPQLGKQARLKLEANDAPIFVSVVSAFELATKHRIGKLPEVAVLLSDYAGYLAGEAFAELPISAAHALRAGRLAIDHRDPFDRLLIAQALEENLILLSNEKRFDTTGVERIWD